MERTAVYITAQTSTDIFSRIVQTPLLRCCLLKGTEKQMDKGTVCNFVLSSEITA